LKIQTTRVYSEVDEAINAGFTTVSAQGSSRSSKTYNILIWLVIYCQRHPGTRLSIVRATLPALKGSVLIDFKEILVKMGIFDERRFNKSDLIYYFANGSWVEFFSTDSEQKIRGRKRDILYCNEANELLFIEWQQLKMRTAKFAIVDYNPSFSDDHWLCELNKDKRTHHFITTYKDNPFLEQTIVDEIESLREKNKALWQIYGLGLQAIVEGLVFTNVEYVDEIPKWVKKRWIGLDFGYTHDPTAAAEVAIEGDVIYIDELFYRSRMLSGDIVRELRPYSALEVVSESADPRLVAEIYIGGINIHSVEKGPGSVEAGITKMLQYKLAITKRSLNAIKEAKNYVYAQDKEGKWLNTPIDAYNHIMDAVRYVVLAKVLGKRSRSINLEGHVF
jgi:phage terminase large subunit